MKLDPDHKNDCWFIGWVIRRSNQMPSVRDMLRENAALHAEACGLAWHDERFTKLAERLRSVRKLYWWEKL